ncbi:MAG: RluA family pseudouridine synthase [Lachnospiraceae bacterium]|nr:RluA family pseudouridine synthase [Lachnospiraceae bacterium]
MKQIIITEAESGQRLDKLLSRYMRMAPKSFLYKMLRRKNITLNGKKAEGKELLRPGDQVKLFLSEDTWEKFGGLPICSEAAESVENTQHRGAERTLLCGAMGHGDIEHSGMICGDEAGQKEIVQVPVLVPGIRPPSVVYQDEHILLFDKPANMLSQKAAPDDISLVEYLHAYLLSSGVMTREQMQLVHPALCNRLDRNTSGLVVAGLSLAGLQTMNRLIKERTIRKYYRCIVCGTVREGGHLRGYLRKDGRTNTVAVTETRMGNGDAKPIETSYRVLAHENDLTLLEVHLITGRSHQIRAHLASIGHPILGDGKYGDAARNRSCQRACGIKSQMLHAYRLEFPGVDGTLSYLSGKTFCAPMPELFARVMPTAIALQMSQSCDTGRSLRALP